MADRFTDFNDQEACLIALGLTITLADFLLGVVTGEPAPPDAQAKSFPVLVALMNELGQRFDVELDPDLMLQAQRVIEDEAREAAAKKN